MFQSISIDIAFMTAITVVAMASLLLQRRWYLNHPIVETIEVPVQRTVEVPYEVEIPTGWSTNRYKPLPYAHYDVSYADISDQGIGTIWRKRDSFSDIGASQLAVVRYAKRRLGINGIRCTREIHDNVIQLELADHSALVTISHCNSNNCLHRELSWAR